MKSIDAIRAVATILLVLWAATLPSGQSFGMGTIFMPHSPIFIQGNGAFTPANGVTGGSGTFADPFIIEGWEVDLSSSSAAYAITVNNTDLPLIIRNVYLHSGDVSYGGIRLSYAANARIENSTMINDATGVYVKSSANVALSFNNVTANRADGIVIISSANVTVVGNVVSHNRGAGIEIELQSTNISLYHNTFIHNQVQAIDKSASSWDNGYPSGGNQWSNYGAADLCGGPNQDECGYPVPPNPDGIGDWPYTIDSNSIDRYPLMPEQSLQSSTSLWPAYWYLVFPTALGAVAVALFVRRSRTSSRPAGTVAT